MTKIMSTRPEPSTLKTRIGCFSTLTLMLWCFWIAGIETRFCDTCLTINCAGAKDICENVGIFVRQQVREYYQYPSGNVPDCPDPKDGKAWLRMRIFETPCDFRICSVGRMKISSFHGNGKLPTLVSYASVFGCINKKSLRSIVKANSAKSRCHVDLISQNRMMSISYKMALEHCNKTGLICTDKDYCIDPEHSIVNDDQGATTKIYQYIKQDATGETMGENRPSIFSFGMTIGITACAVVLVGMLIGFTLCACALKKRSNTACIN